MRQRFFLIFCRVALAIFNLTSWKRLRNTIFYERIGSSYGGWHLPRFFVAGTNNKVAISAGVGEDMSFDLVLASHGWKVLLVDPTPRAKAHFESVLRGPADQISDFAHVDSARQEMVSLASFTFIPFALSGQIGPVRLYFPVNEAHVSLTSLHATKTHFDDVYLDVHAVTIDELVDRFGLQDVSLVKMDIEGSEKVVLDSLLQSNLRPPIILVELDCLRHARTIREFLTTLMSVLATIRELDYEVTRVHGYNLTLEIAS